jgi:hypothetical protein
VVVAQNIFTANEKPEARKFGAPPASAEYRFPIHSLAGMVYNIMTSCSSSSDKGRFLIRLLACCKELPLMKV